METKKQQLKEVRRMYGELTRLKNKGKRHLEAIIRDKKKLKREKKIDTYNDFTFQSLKMNLGALTKEWEKITQSMVWDFNQLLLLESKAYTDRAVQRQLKNVRHQLEEALSTYQKDFMSYYRI